MKRTPLKRKTPLRAKSSLKAKSVLRSTKRLPRRRKKPKHNQSRSAVQAYLEENNECEFKLYGTIDPPGGHCDLLDPHHIGRIRHDRPECLLTLCRQCHNYGHLDDAEFLVWCLWTKHRKSELNLSILNGLKRGAKLEFLITRWELFTEDTVLMARDLLKAIERGEI